jgi:uncharacterized protein (DUF488 family)
MRAEPTIYTIGHGTRATEELVETLGSVGAARLFDVRRFPGSRRNPQFGRDALAASLPPLGVQYVWCGEELGGRRGAKKPSRHPALEDPGFRGYADYMDEPAFAQALARLLDQARHGGPLAIMCAEADWHRCHRRLIADALTLGGVPVVHLLSPTSHVPHRLTRGVRAGEDGRPVYDVEQTGDLFGSR